MDMMQIQSAIALVTSAIGITNQAASTADVIKKLFASKDDSDDGETSKLLNTLAAELTAANVMNVQLSEALKTISRELARQQEFEKEKDRYELFETGQGDLLLKLKTSVANGQPSHYICPVCLNRDKLISYVTGQGDYKLCQTNSAHTFRFSQAEYNRAMRANDDWDRNHF